ncbi:MAG: hypothetical protein KF817_01215 [Phycisphaeraceae bacterium]|nr:hypothetical protein [Phycisphaeraceae bacterium]
MNPFRLRSDLTRQHVGDFALPLGLVPRELPAPGQGYTLDYVAEEEDQDAYRFHVVVSHEKLSPLIADLFALLGDHVDAVLEIGARDAYRSTDVYYSREPLPKSRFEEVWREVEPILLEDGIVGAGAVSVDPDVEIFIDEWKGIFVIVPVEMRARVTAILGRHGLPERPECWPEFDDARLDRLVEVRPVLAVDDEFDPDIDELLYQLREAWDLELDVDPERNVDESGRELGYTLWHVLSVLERADDPRVGAYMSIWLTAANVDQVEHLVEQEAGRHPQWRFIDFYAIDRVAFDERPDALAGLPPRRNRTAIHLVEFDLPGEQEKRRDGRSSRT